MAEFKPFIERRARCSAFRFTEPTEAEFVARSLYWDVQNWYLTHEGNTFTLRVVGPESVIVVGSGDYLVRDPNTLVSVVVPPEEFYPAWELEQ